MSFLRKQPIQTTQPNCNSCNVNPDTGVISLQVVTSPLQDSDSQKKHVLQHQNKLAADIQKQYFAGMDLMSCDTHMKTCNHQQCNEVTYDGRVGLQNVDKLLDEGNLTLRVNHMDHGIDSQATCAEFGTDQLNEMLTTGEAEVACTSGTFKLQSDNNHTISSIKFYRNVD